MLYYNCVGPSVRYLWSVSGHCVDATVLKTTHITLSTNTEMFWLVLVLLDRGPVYLLISYILNRQPGLPEGSKVSVRTSKHQARSSLAEPRARTSHLGAGPLTFWTPPDGNTKEYNSRRMNIGQISFLLGLINSWSWIELHLLLFRSR